MICVLASIANSATVCIHLGYWELPLILGGLATPFLRRRIAISLPTSWTSTVNSHSFGVPDVYLSISHDASFAGKAVRTRGCHLMPLLLQALGQALLWSSASSNPTTLPASSKWLDLGSLVKEYEVEFDFFLFFVKSMWNKNYCFPFNMIPKSTFYVSTHPLQFLTLKPLWTFCYFLSSPSSLSP